VEQYMGGGACEEPMDGGVCPPGTMLDGDCCVFSETTYTCAPLPPSCEGTLTCGCASSLCQCMCVGASSGVLQCACDYP
jgi:hypothetical protein